MAISKIIQKEKERQEMFLFNLKKFKEPETVMIAKHQGDTHKQSLINLKEYLESMKRSLDTVKYLKNSILMVEFKEDIQELTKMIKRYALEGN